MTPLLTVLLVYALGLAVLGAWIGSRVTNTAGFFVSNRSLGPGMLFATLLAANIGSSATVGATSLAYRVGPAAWWWSGSAGIGSFVLAFVVGPRIWRAAKAHNLLTVGDFLNHHYGPSVRLIGAAVIWIGSFYILAAQLIGAGEVLAAAGNLSRPAGCLLATIVLTVYFGAGGLRSAVPVNVVQLIIKFCGFAIAAPLALAAVHGLDAAMALHPAAHSFWRSSDANGGWTALFLLGPAFAFSPGLLQKVYGARDESAVRWGVALNAVGLMAFAVLVVLLGFAARAMFPMLERGDQALPLLMSHGLPFWVSALALAAVFSAEMSAGDAVVFMISTSGARDFYRGLMHPGASDAAVLRAARVMAVGATVVGFVLTAVEPSVIAALGVFYGAIGATLSAPILAALFSRANRMAAMASMVLGVAALIAAQRFGLNWLQTVTGAEWVSPPLTGLFTNLATYLIAALAFGRRGTTPQR
jgi:SSS family solute:Na+ symporter